MSTTRTAPDLPDRIRNRFTDADRLTVIARVARELDLGERDPAVLAHSATRALWLTEYDLRDSEADYITQVVTSLLDLTQPT
jgi:hypothetical protein